MKPRPTRYKGVRMRSRTEALYAASLDGLATWEYEPECFANEQSQYLPDFLVMYTHSRDNWVYVEVKPTRKAALEAAPDMEPILDTHPGSNLETVYPVGTYPGITFKCAMRMSRGGPWREVRE